MKKNVNFILSSKWFFEDQYRIVGNGRGFFVNIQRTHSFVKINGVRGEILSGSIWIKKPDLQGWSKIIHSVAPNKEQVVGFIKQGGVSLLFKQDLTQSFVLKINTV